MDFTILAQAARASSEAAEQAVVPIDWFWQQIVSLDLIEALTFISFGSVCLLYGWRVFKILVVINFGLIGLLLGMTITRHIVGLNNQLAGGLIGMGVLAVLSVPLMKWAVSILGAGIPSFSSRGPTILRMIPLHSRPLDGSMPARGPVPVVHGLDAGWRQPALLPT